MALHPRIKELKLRSMPITYSSLAVDSKGVLAEEDSRIIKGYLIAWGVRDTYGTVFVKGSCAKSLQERGPNSNSKYKITFLWQHDQRDPIGSFSVLREDDYGLYFETNPVDDVPSGDRALKQIRSGTLNQFSVGFDYLWDKIDYDEKTDSLILKEIDLMEGSVVTIGSNCETYAMRSAEQLVTDKENLSDDTEDFIHSIPRKQQLELRQLIARHISLANAQPLDLREKALINEPKKAEKSKGIDYAWFTNNLKLA